MISIAIVLSQGKITYRYVFRKEIFVNRIVQFSDGNPEN